DPKAGKLTLDDGTAVEYDDLLVATGSSAVRAPVPGADGPGVHSFWTLDQARGVVSEVNAGSHVVMVGAGFIAFTILNAILALGARLTIVEIAPQILPRMIDRQGAELVEAWLRRHGVDIRVGATPRVPREPPHEHRRGLPPRRRQLRPLGRSRGRGGDRAAPGAARLPQAALSRRSAHGGDDPRAGGRRLGHQRRGDAEGPGPVRGEAGSLEG